MNGNRGSLFTIYIYKESNFRTSLHCTSNYNKVQFELHFPCPHVLLKSFITLTTQVFSNLKNIITKELDVRESKQSENESNKTYYCKGFIIRKSKKLEIKKIDKLLLDKVDMTWLKYGCQLKKDVYCKINKLDEC